MAGVKMPTSESDVVAGQVNVQFEAVLPVPYGMYVMPPVLSDPLACNCVYMSSTSSKSPLGMGHADSSTGSSVGAIETLSISVPPAPDASVPLRKPIK